MLYARLIEAFYASPWAITPEKFRAMEMFLALKARGDDVPEEEIVAVVAGRRPANVTMAGKVAILPVFGVIAQRLGTMDRASGGVSTEELAAALDNLVADRQVKSIVMVHDSPGGSVYNVPELAAKIRDVAAQKKVTGIADSVSASASYWLLAQSTEVIVSPSSQVGSIGVLAVHADLSQWEEMQGIKTTYISSSPYKVEGAPENPLSPEARGEIQSKVDAYHAMFVRDVAKGRKVSETRVNSDFGEGRMVTARDAVARGMADRVLTLEQVLARLGAEGGPTPYAMAARARAVEVQEG